MIDPVHDGPVGQPADFLGREWPKHGPTVPKAPVFFPVLVAARVRRCHTKAMARKWRHEALSLELPDDRPLSLALVADTHSKPHPGAGEWIAKERPDHILHAGDIGDESCLDVFRDIAPTTAVRGNIDGLGLPDSYAIDIMSPRGKELTIFLMHIAVYGPKIRGDAAKRAKQHNASLLVCGHSHVPFLGRDKGLTVFNPGSVGPRRFRLPITFGMMVFSKDRFELEHVDCETGKRWAP